MEEAAAEEFAGLLCEWARETIAQLMKNDPELRRKSEEFTVWCYERLARSGRQMLEKRGNSDGSPRRRAQRAR